MVGDSVWKEQTATVLHCIPAPSPVPLPQTHPSLPVSDCSPVIVSVRQFLEGAEFSIPSLYFEVFWVGLPFGGTGG